MNISVKNEKTFIEFENILHTIIYRLNQIIKILKS